MDFPLFLRMKPDAAQCVHNLLWRKSSWLERPLIACAHLESRNDCRYKYVISVPLVEEQIHKQGRIHPLGEVGHCLRRQIFVGDISESTTEETKHSSEILDSEEQHRNDSTKKQGRKLDRPKGGEFENAALSTNVRSVGEKSIDSKHPHLVSDLRISIVRLSSLDIPGPRNLTLNHFPASKNSMQPLVLSSSNSFQRWSEPCERVFLFRRRKSLAFRAVSFGLACESCSARISRDPNNNMTSREYPTCSECRGRQSLWRHPTEFSVGNWRNCDNDLDQELKVHIGSPWFTRRKYA